MLEKYYKYKVQYNSLCERVNNNLENVLERIESII